MICIGIGRAGIIAQSPLHIRSAPTFTLNTAPPMPFIRLRACETYGFFGHPFTPFCISHSLTLVQFPLRSLRFKSHKTHGRPSETTAVFAPLTSFPATAGLHRHSFVVSRDARTQSAVAVQLFH